MVQYSTVWYGIVQCKMVGMIWYLGCLLSCRAPVSPSHTPCTPKQSPNKAQLSLFSPHVGWACMAQGHSLSVTKYGLLIWAPAPFVLLHVGFVHCLPWLCKDSKVLTHDTLGPFVWIFDSRLSQDQATHNRVLMSRMPLWKAP